MQRGSRAFFSLNDPSIIYFISKRKSKDCVIPEMGPSSSRAPTAIKIRMGTDNGVILFFKILPLIFAACCSFLNVDGNNDDFEHVDEVGFFLLESSLLRLLRQKLHPPMLLLPLTKVVFVLLV